MQDSDAEAALIALADPLVWTAPSPDGGLLFAEGVYAWYSTRVPPYPKDTKDAPVVTAWKLSVSSKKAGRGLTVDCLTLAGLKAIATHHALTGDWLELLRLAKYLDWTKDKKGLKAPGGGGRYRIRKTWISGSRCVYTPRYQHTDKGTPPYLIPGKPHFCPCTFESVDDAKFACERHLVFREWTE